MAPPLAGFREFSTRDRREQASRMSFSIAVAREAGPTGPVCPVPFAGRPAGAGASYGSVESARFHGHLEVLMDPAATGRRR